MGLVRWVLFEVLPLPVSTRGFHLVGVVCRLVGCTVSLAILTMELRASAASHGEVLALLWAVSVLTALLIGNVAREVLFGVCSSVASLMGRKFYRDGVTFGGRSFLEIHYPTKTWLRCECVADEISCEWTDPTGRCSRLDLQLRPDSAHSAKRRQPVMRMTTAPRMVSN